MKNIEHYNLIASSSVPWMLRLKSTDGTYLTQSTTQSITLNVYDITTDTRTLVQTQSLVVANTMTNTLSTASTWTKDSEGFNGLVVITTPPLDSTYDYRPSVVTTAGTTVQAAWTVTGI